MGSILTSVIGTLLSLLLAWAFVKYIYHPFCVSAKFSFYFGINTTKKSLDKIVYLPSTLKIKNESSYEIFDIKATLFLKPYSQTMSIEVQAMLPYGNIILKDELMLDKEALPENFSNIVDRIEIDYKLKSGVNKKYVSKEIIIS